MSRFLLILANDAIRKKAKKWIDAAPDGMRLEFREAKRSKEANDKMWACLTDVSKQVLHRGVEYDTETWKILFMAAWSGQELRYIPALDEDKSGGFIPVGYRSSELSVAEMSDLIEFIQSWGAQHGVVFHDPETRKGADGPGEPPTPDKEARTNAPVLLNHTQSS